MKHVYGIPIEEIKRMTASDDIVALCFIHESTEDKTHLSICPQDHAGNIKLNEVITIKSAD